MTGSPWPVLDGLLCVDVGGSGIRAGIIGSSGALRSLISRPDPGRAERFNPEVTWRAVASVIRDLTMSGARLRAVGLTAHLATVLTGPDGQPSAQGMLWRDNRAWREARELSVLLGPELEWVTGRPASAESAAARVRMLGKTRPGVLGRTRWLLSLKDYLTMQLTGTACTDPATASYTQLFDVRERRWSERIAEVCGVPTEILPPVRASIALAGRVTPAAAALTGLEPGTPVAVGGPDGSTGALGVGAVRAGLTVDIAGTTDVLLHVTDTPAARVSGGTVLNAYLLDDLWTIGGPTGLTGGGLDWLAATLGHESADAAYRALGPTLDAADPGELLVRTTLTGRRLPGWDARVRGRIDGISGEHGPAHLIRAAEEGSAFEVRLGIDALRASGAEVSGVILAGGTAVSPRAAQLRANVWGVEIGAAAQRHASLRGAALAAAVAAGQFAGAREAAAAMVAPTRRYGPDPAGAAAAERRYRRWREVMDLLAKAGSARLGAPEKKPRAEFAHCYAESHFPERMACRAAAASPSAGLGKISRDCQPGKPWSTRQ